MVELCVLGLRDTDLELQKDDGFQDTGRVTQCHLLLSYGYYDAIPMSNITMINDYQSFMYTIKSLFCGIMTMKPSILDMAYSAEISK